MSKSKPDKPSTGQRLQDAVLVCIVLAVGLMAGAASFNHVHDWTMHNSPTGTADWFGWANAVITELIPTAALIVIARRRRHGGSIGYPMLLLIVAVGLSLTAQLAVAVPTVFGWMVSALPALAFFALSKLVFTTTAAHRPDNSGPVPKSATVTPATSTKDTATVTVRPTAAPPPATTPTPSRTPANQPSMRLPAQTSPVPATAEPAPAKPVPVNPAPVAVAELLPGARILAKAHHDAHGEPITAGQLAARMRVPTTTAKDVLTLLYPEPAANTQPHNGTPIGAHR